MKLVKSEKLEKSMHELQFSVDAEAFEAAINKVFKKEGKKFAVPGFRKGKATRGMIEKMYGADVFFFDAVNELFPEAYEAAVAEAGIEVVGQPEADIVSMSREEGVVLKAIVPVKPEVTLGEYVGLKATKLVNAVEDEDVEARLAQMQDRNARMITVEGAAALGDTADIDFEGFADGVAFEGGKAEHHKLELGSGSFIPGFEEQVVGHAAGEEFDVNVTFPTEYHSEDLAGKEAVFKIKLHAVERKELPELDDEFAKDVSEFDTLDELKADLRKNMEEANEQNAKIQVENALVDQIAEGMQADIPAAMIENAIDNEMNNFSNRLMQQGLNIQDYMKYLNTNVEEMREQFRERAEKQVKIQLAVDAVVAKEGITASEEEIEAHYQKMAEQYGMQADQLKTYFDAEMVAKDVCAAKAIDFVVEKAEITTETVSTKVVEAEEAKAETDAE